MATDPEINEIASVLTDHQFDFSESEGGSLNKAQKDNFLEREDTNTDL